MRGRRDALIGALSKSKKPRLRGLERAEAALNRIEMKSLRIDLESTSWQILFNNLGGFGPGDPSQPSLLRFSKTCAVNGQQVDLVLSAPHGYHPGRVQENGAFEGYAAVNVAPGSSVDLRLLLTSREAPVMLSRLYVSVFDEKTKRLSSEGKVAIRGFQAH